MKYIIFLLHGYLELFRKKEGKTLFEYAKKNYFEDFMENGRWGYVFFDKSLEKSYFKFLSPIRNFPGEAFLRALKYKIDINKNDTFFLGKFVFSFDNKIVETNVNLNLNEKQILLEEIKKEKNYFEFYIFEKDIILKFSENLPFVENKFPNKILNYKIENILFKKKYFEKLNDVMKGSLDILKGHPINKVRVDLNEPQGNFLYFYGMGRYIDTFFLKNIIKKEIFYFSEGDILTGLTEFFKIEKIDKIPNLKNEECIYWFDFSLDYKTSPSIWVKNFENFSKEILKEFSYKENIKFLFIFDPFMNENFEYESGISLFLGVNFSEKLKKKFKNPYLLFQKFIK